MSVAKSTSKVPRWLIPVVVLVAVLTAGSGLVVRQLYVTTQTGSTPGQISTTPGPSQTGKQPDLTVSFAADAAVHPLAGQVRTLLQGYFDAINSGSYDQWRTLVTAKALTLNPQSQWEQAYATSKDSDVYVYRINSTASDGVTVLLSFISRQQLAYAPTQAPSTCDKWWLVLPFRWERNTLKVDVGSSNSTPEVKVCS